jgi:hypothetical protein
MPTAMLLGSRIQPESFLDGACLELLYGLLSDSCANEQDALRQTDVSGGIPLCPRTACVAAQAAHRSKEHLQFAMLSGIWVGHGGARQPVRCT